MIQVYPVPAFQDNYLWLFHRRGYSEAYIVDPGDAGPVLHALEQRQLKLAGILITHHHMDHIGGVKQLLQHFDVPVYGPDCKNIPQVSHPLREGDSIKLSAEIAFRVIEVPGHTLEHIAYFSPANATSTPGEGAAEEENPPLLFCGDTLFAGGCGRLFEGTAAQMYASLSKLAQLPDNTQVYCAHEYTLANLNFAIAVEPDNASLQLRLDEEKQKRQEGIPTVPSSMAREKATNPFLRCLFPSIKAAAERKTGADLDTPAAVLGAVRAWKDSL